MNEAAEYLILQRLEAYPIQLLKLGYYLEKQPIIWGIYQFHKRLFQHLDLNFYFFANHPNSRVGIEEAEKFPFVLLAFFIHGFFLLAQKRNRRYFILLLIILVYTASSQENGAHTFVMYPFIAYPIYISFRNIYENFITK